MDIHDIINRTTALNEAIDIIQTQLEKIEVPLKRKVSLLAGAVGIYHFSSPQGFSVVGENVYFSYIEYGDDCIPDEEVAMMIPKRFIELDDEGEARRQYIEWYDEQKKFLEKTVSEQKEAEIRKAERAEYERLRAKFEYETKF